MEYESLESLVGKNAGVIAMTLELPYVEPFRAVIDIALAVQESFCSPWTFAGLDPSGNTLWIAPEQERVLCVDPDGAMKIERR